MNLHEYMEINIWIYHESTLENQRWHQSAFGNVCCFRLQRGFVTLINWCKTSSMPRTVCGGFFGERWQLLIRKMLSLAMEITSNRNGKKNGRTPTSPCSSTTTNSAQRSRSWKRRSQSTRKSAPRGWRGECKKMEVFGNFGET